MAAHYTRRKLILFFCFLMMLIAAIGLHHFKPDTEVQLQPSISSNTTFRESSESKNLFIEELRYIPHSTVQTWKNRDYLIVFGVPSMDVMRQMKRRHLQRTTCWQFPGVAKRINNFTGDMLVLYVLARHPIQGYRYSAALLKEVEEYHDVITLPMNEGVSTSNKLLTGRGHWGLEAEIGLSRKVFMWFELALRLFPNTSYISKGDDDMFLRVPQFLADLRTLPRRGLYWGSMTTIRSKVVFRFAAGACYTLGRDVAEQLVLYEPLKRLIHLPYGVEREEVYISRYVQHEDVMVGRALHEMRYNYTFVGEPSCRFYKLNRGSNKRHMGPYSVMVHCVRDREYFLLMKRFGSETSPPAKKFRLFQDSFLFEC